MWVIFALQIRIPNRIQSGYGYGSGSVTLVKGANILHLLAASTVASNPGVEGVLWPHLLEFLLQPEYTAAVAAISKALNVVAVRRVVATEGEGLAVAYQNLQVSSVAEL